MISVFLIHKLFETLSIITRRIIQNIGVFPPQEKGVKKISGFFVKKTVLSERSEFTVFRKKQ